MEILGQTLARRLAILCLIAISIVGCGSDSSNDGMHTEAPKMSAEEQKKIEGSRHDAETQKMLDSRPR